MLRRNLCLAFDRLGGFGFAGLRGGTVLRLRGARRLLAGCGLFDVSGFGDGRFCCRCFRNCFCRRGFRNSRLALSHRDEQCAASLPHLGYQPQ